jgi:DNA-binding IclR family transcriptional regulator
VYRDDAAALEERGAALEEQLAPLRVSGPPGAVVRVEELRRQLREVRRFGWAYAWLALCCPSPS